MSSYDGGPESMTQALRDSEERYRLLFDSIDEGFCIIEVLFDERGRPVDYRFLEMNSAFLAQTGLVDARGRTVRELVPRHEDHWFEIYGRVALTGEPARFEQAAAHLNPPRWYDVYAFRHGPAESRQVAVLFKDIGPRKRAEEALAETERRYRELIRQAPAGIYEIDFRTGRFVSVNDSMCAMLGYSRDELLAVDPSAIMDEQSRTRFEARTRRLLSGEEPEREVEYRVKARDGRIIDAVLNVTFTKGADGRPLGATVIAHDVTERKRAEEALRESEELLRAVIDNSPAAIYVKDRASRWLMANPAVLRIVGRTADQALGRTDVELYADPAVGGAILENDRRIMESGRTEAIEEVADTPDGRRTFMSVKAPRRDAHGNVIGLVGISHDITARKQAEDALRESKEALSRFNAELEHQVASRTRELSESREALKAERQRFLDMLDTLPVVIDIIRADHRIEWTNRAYRDALGDNTGKLCYASQFGLEEPCAECQAFIPLQSGQPHRWEWTLPNGRTFDIHNFPFAASDGSPAILEMDIDVTEQRQAEIVLRDSKATLERHVAERTAALRESEERFRVIVETANEGIATHDPSGTITYVNQRMADMLGYSREEMIGRSSLDFVDHEEKDAVNRAQTGLKERGSVSRERKLRRKDGAVLWTLANLSPRHDSAGTFVGYMAMHTDITTRKRAEEALREADRRKDEFIAILSHELRNPLAPIRYALPLLSEERLGEGGRHAVAVVDRQVTHLTRLVDDLLDVSRIATGKIELRPEHVTLSAVLSAAVEAASPAIAAAQHSLEVAVPSAPIWLNADAARISQAVTNLLNNSAKYTRKGGRIRLEATTTDKEVVIRVADNGVGIAPSQLSAVFEMFRQGDGVRKSQGGLGIGLSLTRQLVEIHGGSVEAHSAGEDQGAEFVIRLPLAVPATRPVERQPLTPSGNRASLRVLVVDDNVDLVDMLAMVVEADGHQVWKAVDGRSAISAALEYQPHLILLDVGMPDMNGIEVAKELRRHPALGRTRIVALTGWGQAEDRRRTAEAGFDDHVTKPADPRQIQRILEDVANRVVDA